MFLKAVLSAVLVAALFATAQSAEGSLSAEIGHRSDKRQLQPGTCSDEQFAVYFANYPLDCQEAATSILSLNILDPNSAPAVAAIGDVFCPPRCSRAAAAFAFNCGLTEIGTLVSGFCGTNSDGEQCYDLFTDLFDVNALIIRECPAIPALSTCSPSCRAAIVSGRDRLGCCANVYNNTFSARLTIADDFELWDLCDVSTPGVCQTTISIPGSTISIPGSTISIPGSAALLHFSYLLTALLLMAAASMMY